MDYLSAAFFLGALGKRAPVLIELFLISCAHIAKPFAIGLDFAGVGVSRECFELLHVGLGSVHIEPVDGGSCTELGAWLVS